MVAWGTAAAFMGILIFVTVIAVSIIGYWYKKKTFAIDM